MNNQAILSAIYEGINKYLRKREEYLNVEKVRFKALSDTLSNVNDLFINALRTVNIDAIEGYFFSFDDADLILNVILHENLDKDAVMKAVSLIDRNIVDILLNYKLDNIIYMIFQGGKKRYISKDSLKVMWIAMDENNEKGEIK